MIRLLVLVVLVLGCDKARQDKNEPLPPPKELTCQTDLECVLRSADPCNPCGSCKAFHASTHAARCAKTIDEVVCAVAPCDGVVATCIKGACATRPK